MKHHDFWPTVTLADGRVITSEQCLKREERRYRGLRRWIKRQLPLIVRLLGQRAAGRFYDFLRLKNE